MRAAVKLHYFAKKPQYKYGRLQEADQAVIRRIISQTLDKDSLKAVITRLSEDTLTRYPTIFSEQGLQPPLYFLEWTQNFESYKLYLKAFQKSYVADAFYEWYAQHQANPPNPP